MKKKISLLLAAAVLLTSVTSMAASGTERTWSVTLPHHYENAYFTARDKETNETKGTLKLTSLKGTSGINGWFNSGNKIVSNIVTATTTNVIYDVRYNSHSSKGNVINLGVENYENTSFNNDTASGTVNYK